MAAETGGGGGGGCPQQEQLHRCFHSWINQQEKDLNELDQAAKEDRRNEERLKTLAEKNIKHFQEYHEKRILLLKQDPPSSFSPTWCTPFENSFLWIAGCRPTLAIQLVYTLCGSELEAHLTDFLQGVRIGNLGEISPVQLSLIDELHCKTVREEEEISNRMERLQEYIIGGEEEQLGLINADEESITQKICDYDQSNGHHLTSRAIDAHAAELGNIWEEADGLRLKTTKVLIGILTPLQAVDFLVAAKKLYLYMIDCGQRRRDSIPEPPIQKK